MIVVGAVVELGDALAWFDPREAGAAGLGDVPQAAEPRVGEGGRS